MEKRLFLFKIRMRIMLISSRHWTLSVPVKGSGLITDRMNELRKKTHVTRQEWTTPVGSSNVWSVCVYVRTIICIHQEDEKCQGRRQRGRRLRAVLSECFDRTPPSPPLPPPPSIPSIEFPAVATRQEWTTPAGSFSEWSAVWVYARICNIPGRREVPREKTQR